MCVQNAFYLDLSMTRSTPEWLDPEMAEQLRHSVEARQLLEQEYEQVIPQHTVGRSAHSALVWHGTSPQHVVEPSGNECCCSVDRRETFTVAAGNVP